MTTSVNPPGHSDEFTRPPLTYPGNKSELAEEIIEYLPQHETYVAPFGGTAGVLFNKERSRNEVINDINSDLTTFMKVLRDDPDSLVEWLRTTPYSQEAYNDLRERWKKGIRPDDDVAQAGQLFFLRRASFGGDMGGFRAIASGRKNSARQFSNARERLFELAERLDGVVIRNADWRDIVEQYASPETVFYLDPPYRGVDGYYEGEFHYPDFELYFIRHMDGTYNKEIDDPHGPVPPAFTTQREYEPEDDKLYPLSELPISPSDIGSDIAAPDFPWTPSEAQRCDIDHDDVVRKGTELYVSGEALSADDVYSYGTEDDPIRFLISSEGPIDGLLPYTWTVKLGEYTHEINNIAGGSREVSECLTMNYDPDGEDFTQFTGLNTGLGSFC